MKYFIVVLKFDKVTGGGERKPFCQKFLNPLLKFKQLFFKKLKQNFHLDKNYLRSPKGAILIEFAFCLPVLILLIYYIHDLNRLKRYYSQTEFVGQQIASMIQNISQARENKAITKKELQRIARMAYLSIFPGMSMYNKSGYNYEFGHVFVLQIVYVKGLDNGNASCIWRYYYRTPYIDESTVGLIYTEDRVSLRPLHFLTDVAPSEIYPSLTINPGESKIIIISQLFRDCDQTKSLNGKYVTDKEAFNFYLITPKNTGAYGSRDLCQFFPSIVIFTPKPGLFSETPPA